MSLDIGVTGYLELGKKKYDLTIISNGKNYLEGTCDFDNNELTVGFAVQHASTNIVCSLKGKDGNSITFNKEFIKRISNDFAELVPGEFEIVLDSALFAINKHKEDTGVLFWVKYEASIDLSNLPMVGKAFPEGRRVQLDNFQVLINKGNFDPGELNKIITNDSLKLPATIVKGANFSADMLFGEERKTVEISLGNLKPE